MGDFYEYLEGQHIECKVTHDHAVETDKSEKVLKSWNVSAGEAISISTIGKVSIVGIEEISLVCGGASIKLGPKGITMRGLIIDEQAEVKHQVQAVQIERQSGATSVDQHPLQQEN